MKILIANVGSSSLKCQLFDMPAETVLAKVHVERIGSDKAPVEWSIRSGPTQKVVVPMPDYVSAMQFVLDTLTDPQVGVLRSIADLEAVGFKAGLAKGITGCCLMDEPVLAALDEYSDIVAPLHNKIYVQAIRYFRKLLPHTPFIGLFETFFCQNLPDYEAVYPIPWEWTKTYNIRKTMGHGASHFYVNHRIAELTQRPREENNVIQLHLGGSSSLAAIQQGVNMGGTVGFTTQCGLPYSNRASDFDPCLIPFLVSRGEGTMEEVMARLLTEGGLSALSGMGFDMRDLQEAASKGHDRARLTIDFYVNQIRKYLGIALVALGHTDVITFAGGTGESSPFIRRRILENLEDFGILLDEEKNKNCFRKEGRISQNESKLEIWVVPTNEEIVVARECVKFLKNSTKNKEWL
jgi:acetate kinase